MMERGFLDVKSIKDVVISRENKRLITLAPDATVSEAVHLFKKYNIEQIPVFQNEELIGTISEIGLFNKLFSNPEIKQATISELLEEPLPVLSYDTPIERIRFFINKEIGAVLTRDETGAYHIITKYDLINTLSW
jgi:cystathionine beta-synthase